jgi:leucyl aminopeptidase
VRRQEHTRLLWPNWYADYDLESFAYVLLWITGRYDRGRLADHDAYSGWITTQDVSSLAKIKLVDLENPECTPSHRAFEVVVCSFAEAIRNRIRKSRNRLAKLLGVTQKAPPQALNSELPQTKDIFELIDWAAKVINSPADVCRAHQHLFDALLEHIVSLDEVKKEIAETEELLCDNLPYRWLAER